MAPNEIKVRIKYFLIRGVGRGSDRIPEYLFVVMDKEMAASLTKDGMSSYVYTGNIHLLLQCLASIRGYNCALFDSARTTI